jgi:F-type H+-transporting ATPase subunit b
MQLISPGFGLTFWMLLSFGIILFLLGKFAWKPILNALKQRENSIENALKSAENAKQELARLKADNKRIMEEAKQERDKVLHEAREIKDNLIEEAKTHAAEESVKIRKAARESIEREKAAAMNDLKNQIATYSIEIAEKLLKARLKDSEEQKEMIERLIEDVKLN